MRGRKFREQSSFGGVIRIIISLGRGVEVFIDTIIIIVTGLHVDV